MERRLPLPKGEKMRRKWHYRGISGRWVDHTTSTKQELQNTGVRTFAAGSRQSTVGQNSAHGSDTHSGGCTADHLAACSPGRQPHHKEEETCNWNLTMTDAA